METKLIIGISGMPLSGKTSIAQRICSKYNNKVTIVYQEWFRSKVGKLTPNAFDNVKLAACLSNLKCGVSYAVNDRMINPTPVIIVVGLFPFNDLLVPVNIKLFIDCGNDISLSRYVVRGINEKKEVMDVLSEYFKYVKPSIKYFLRQKSKADIIINSENSNTLSNEIPSSLNNEILNSLMDSKIQLITSAIDKLI